MESYALGILPWKEHSFISIIFQQKLITWTLSWEISENPKLRKSSEMLVCSFQKCQLYEWQRKVEEIFQIKRD